MPASAACALILGAAFNATAALAHLACIVLGAPAYRFMGAGEKMARAAEARRVRPALLTLAIAAALFTAAACALSGAGVVGRLPFLKVALAGIVAVYLARAAATTLLKPAFPENSPRFWRVSGGLCLVIGLVHLYGTALRWPSL